MLENWLNYCSKKQKEISDKLYQKMDSVLLELYSKKKNQRRRICVRRGQEEKCSAEYPNELHEWQHRSKRISRWRCWADRRYEEVCR